MNVGNDNMSECCDNNQKYLNYKEQMGRLNKAIKYEFYMEAILIEGAVIEDRIESFLRASDVFNPEKHNTLDRKLSRLCELQRNKKSIIRKYVSDEVIESIYSWKKERNALVHALLKQNVSTDEIVNAVNIGRTIVKTLNSKSTSYRRMMKKQQ